MQISISKIFEFGPDPDGKGFYGFTVVKSALSYKNHIFEYNRATRSEICSIAQQMYNRLQKRITKGADRPKGETP